MLPVLPATANIIPERPVRQQKDQEKHIEVRRGVLKQSRGGPKERPSDLGKVVEVPGHPPPSCVQQEGRRFFSAGVGVVSRDVLCRFAPHHDVALSLQVGTQNRQQAVGMGGVGEGRM